MSDEFKEFESVPTPTLVFGSEETQDAAGTAADAAESAADAVTTAAADAAQTAGEAVTTASETVEAAAEEVKDAVTTAAGEVTEAAGEAADAAAETAETAAESTQDKIQATQETVAAAQEAVLQAQQAVAEATANALEAATATAKVESAAAAGAAAAMAAPSEATAQAAAQTGLSAQVSDDMLTEEEKAQVDAFSERIDVTDSTAVLQYGAGAQKKMVDFSEKALENVRTKDMGEVGDMIASLVTQLKTFDSDEERGGFLAGLFKKNTDRLATMKARYDKVEVNVDEICRVLEEHQVTLIKDIALLDKMYELNLAYFKELTMYILAGKKALDRVRSTKLKELQEKAKRSGLAEDAQAARDLEEQCLRFEKKLYDLELTRTVALQTAPQIRLVQDSDEVMVEKIQSTLVNTIPLWKNQMVIALGVEHSNEAAKAQQAVTDLTNQLLEKNAEALKTATIETAEASERGIVDMETLKSTNATLISTLDEVLRIQTEGRQKRAQAESEMQAMEAELKKKLLQLSRADV